MSAGLVRRLTWMDRGTELFLQVAGWVDESRFRRPSLLPGWSRAHVMAHVAANAEALTRLARWARTGVETPMYASVQARDTEIERSALRPADRLMTWLEQSSEVLSNELDGLTPEHWGAMVRTAQGRVVPATAIPWLRAREVYVHAVDLDRNVGFGSLPDDFLRELCDDARRRRGDVPEARGPLAEKTAWLTGRPHQLLSAGGQPVPDLPPWL